MVKNKWYIRQHIDGTWCIYSGNAFQFKFMYFVNVWKLMFGVEPYAK
jgi:hypothetical protein